MGIQVEFNKVYKRVELDELKYSPARKGESTIEINAAGFDGEDHLDGVMVYVSNSIEKPEDYTSMKKTDTLKDGLYTVGSRTTWICFVKVSAEDDYEVLTEGLLPDVSTKRGKIFNQDPIE